jgi:hypothetical protein
VATRRRDYKAEYARRQARARELGYESYYARRVRAGAAPSTPAPTGERLRRARGHNSTTDLLAAVKPGRLVYSINTSPRDDRGRFTWVEVTVVDEKGHERNFRLRGRQATNAYLRQLVTDIRDAGGVVGVFYPLDDKKKKRR